VDDDGNGYCFPCDAERVLMIDAANDTVRCIGPALLEGENKWQNGFAGPDGCVYAVPQRSAGVIRIVPGSKTGGEPRVEMLECGPDYDGCKEKFEGGELASDGSIVCIPLRAKHVLQIKPK
jgi:hypothetical protein